ncbi:doublesex- and mab-3-related transcription factor A2-like isoform X3 [Orbicella faveolata]|uniref:doublesex- and mab-3-related transcription factor A2-like isoform X3 n=1 Tax=Orbicella faveolata TaxID=48498 RepID=UPI0009E54691|nr:doublesex- and mab-3-related transcription factor A2-like isoform X3 [Orbicella faveolata]
MSGRVQMKCRLCKNHGILTPLRGHKFNCPFRRCNCLNCKTRQMHNRSRVQPDENKRAINDVESTVNQRVIAWINGEEDESVEAHVSDQVQSEDEPCTSQFQQTVTYSGSFPSTPADSQGPGLTNGNKVTTSAGRASGKSLAVKLPRVALMKALSSAQAPQAATTVARAQILKQIKELYDLKECGALSANEYEDAKAVVLRDFK